MTFKTRYLRLLPSVMLICGGLLVLKASGLVHEALAASGKPAQADAMAPPPAAVNKDYSGDDSEIASAAEADVLTSLSKRRSELDARQAQIQIQSNVLAATETRVDAKIAQLKQLQTQIAALLTQRDAEQQKQIAALVKTYSTMGKKAGPVFAGLPDDVAVPVAQAMKSDDLATIMSSMPTEAAQKLSVKLANKLNLPSAVPAMDPPPAPPAPAPAAGSVSPAPAPTQTANAVKPAAPAGAAKPGN
jgi:flagellar motility protein MotE (MotC chaperone)